MASAIAFSLLKNDMQPAQRQQYNDDNDDNNNDDDNDSKDNNNNGTGNHLPKM
jgi:hypothetical protein